MRVLRTREELHEALRDQLELLDLNCEAFDRGRLVAGRQIATVLRTLLLEPAKRKTHTAPLLRLAGSIPPRFRCLAFSIESKNLSVLKGAGARADRQPRVCGLVNFAVNKNLAAFFAPLDDVPADEARWLSFPDWWNAPVLRDYRGRTLSRLELVSHVASTDGGAHVDAGLDPQYAEAKNGIALGYYVEEQNGERRYVRDLELHCMRQIGHEVRRTVERYVRDAVQDVQPYKSVAYLPVPMAGVAVIGARLALSGKILIGSPDGDQVRVGSDEL